MKSDLNETRTYKSSKNAIISIFCQVISILIQFVVRTFFINYLSGELLGVNGVFSNVLTVLSLTELGLGTAIVCCMYTAMAQKDEKLIRVYFQSFKKIYSVIGVVVILLGLSLLPFLNYLVKDANSITNLQYYYLVYLLDVAASYFFSHYRALLSADQKDFVNTIVRTLFLIIQTIIQIFVLVFLGSYFTFLGIKIICNVFSGFVISIIVKKKYPYITIKENARLSNQDKKTLVSDSIGVLSTKIELTILNSTDNLIISSFLGSLLAGIYSNYILIIGAISTATGLVYSAVEASIGNFCVVKEKRDILNLFDRIHYVYYVFYGFATCCLVGLLNPFIDFWLGKSFLLDYNIVILISLVFFISSSRQANLSFITVNHLLNKLNIKNIIEAVVNIAISIVLVMSIGLQGVFWGTIISLLTCSVWIEPKTLYDYLGGSIVKYFGKFLVRFVIVMCGAVFCAYISSRIYNGQFISLITCFIINIIISISFVTLPFVRSKEFQQLLYSIKALIKRKIT